jgi:hypothetical protein
MAQLRHRKRTAGILGAVAAAAIAGTSSAATPVSGSVTGPVTSVKGSSFTLTTSLSPTGHSMVELSSTTKTTAQATGKRSNLKNGVCLLVTGTSQGSSIAAARIVIRSCSSSTRPTGGGPVEGGGGPLGGGAGGAGVSRPANFAIATGAITSIAGSTVTVKGQNGTSSVRLSSSTQLVRTVTVKPSAIKVDECAFVRGASTDGGATVKAQNVSLTPASKSGCTTPFGRA